MSKGNLNLRINLVIDLILDGYSRSHILRVCSEQWGVKIRQADRYIHEATAEIQEVTSSTAERDLAVLTSNMWRLYRRNASDPDNQAVCRQILMDIAKLKGLDKIDITLNVKRDFKDSSDDDLLAAIESGA